MTYRPFNALILVVVVVLAACAAPSASTIGSSRDGTVTEAPAPPAHHDVTPAPEPSTPPGSAPPTETTTAPTTTVVPTSFEDVPSNFDVSDWLISAWEQNPSSGYPAFRMFCSFSHLAHHDPIVDPGNENFMHLHMFFGNTAVDQDSTYQSLRATGDSTCDGGPLNRTAYWMPAVFDRAGDVVVPSRFELYYKAENAADPRQIQAKPNGLRMIAGAPDTRVFRWTCSGGAGITIPSCNVGSRLTVSVRFPYCWDGRNLDAPDHRSHLSYGVNNTWGPCPASHPVHLPELTEFAHFDNVPAGTADWYLASDRMDPNDPAPGGSTMHADWFGAWDNPIQERWVDNCLRGSRNASNGNLCDGTQLRPHTTYSGPQRIGGWTPTS